MFALGNAGSSPNFKTGAAIRKLAPVVVAKLRAPMIDTTHETHRHVRPQAPRPAVAVLASWPFSVAADLACDARPRLNSFRSNRDIDTISSRARSVPPSG